MSILWKKKMPLAEEIKMPNKGMGTIHAVFSRYPKGE
jgi:hypothetical protein